MILPTYFLRRLPATTLHLMSKNPGVIATSRPITQSSSFTTSAGKKLVKEDNMNKDRINTESTEYSKSGTDNEAANQESVAFNPDVTDPAAEKKKAGESNEESGNPLDASPANHDISKPRSTTEGGAENSASGDKNGKNSSDRSQSGFGSPKKSG